MEVSRLESRAKGGRRGKGPGGRGEKVVGASVGETPEVLRGCEEHTERLTAYQRRLMKDVAEMSIAMPHSHAMTPARLFTPRLGQSKVSSTQLHTMITIRKCNTL